MTSAAAWGAAPPNSLRRRGTARAARAAPTTNGLERSGCKKIGVLGALPERPIVAFPNNIPSSAPSNSMGVLVGTRVASLRNVHP